MVMVRRRDEGVAERRRQAPASSASAPSGVASLVGAQHIDSTRIVGVDGFGRSP
jgi:hypothetical protein